MLELFTSLSIIYLTYFQHRLPLGRQLGFYK